MTDKSREELKFDYALRKADKALRNSRIAATLSMAAALLVLWFWMWK